MKNSKYAIIAFVLSLMVIVPAILIFLAEYFHLSVSHPLAGLVFWIGMITYLPEMPLGGLIQHFGFPVVLPLLTVVFAGGSLIVRESRKRLAITSIVLVILGVLIYLGIRVFIG